MAYTNHALDHMLKGILDANITTSIIRLGSREAADERIAPFALEAVEKAQGKTSLTQAIGGAFKEMKNAETDMLELMEDIDSRTIPPGHLRECVQSSYPRHYRELFVKPPSWISTLITQAGQNSEGWRSTERRQRDTSNLGYWISGRDLDFLRSPPGARAAQAPVPGPSRPRLNLFEALAKRLPEANQKPSKIGPLAVHV